MNQDPSFSKSSLASPRSNRQRYHELKHETDPADELAEAEDRPSTSSLKRALARANLKGDCVLSGYAGTLPSLPGNPESDSRMNSSLPLALARANESRKMNKNEVLKVDVKEPESSEATSKASLADFFFRFDRFADVVHPLRGWGAFGIVFIFSTLILGHGPALALLPVHSGARALSSEAIFWGGYLGRALGVGMMLTFTGALMASGMYRISIGCPPFLWVFKIFVYALAPLTLAQLYLILSLSDIGIEPYIRGYRPESWGLSQQVTFTVMSLWVFVRMVQSAPSRHCQASPARMAVPLSVALLLSFGGIWGQDFLQDAAGRGRMSVAVSETEVFFKEADSGSLARVEGLGEVSAYGWSHDLKVRLYLIRSEIRLLNQDVNGAREDAVRLVRMHPQRHLMSAYGRGLNLLALGHTEEGLRQLELVDQAMDSELTVCGRWLFRIRRGDYGEASADIRLAEEHARQVYFLEPNPMHLEMLVDAIFVLEQDRRLLRELLEAERMGINLTPQTALRGAKVGARTDRPDLSERWLSRALAGAPSLAEDPQVLIIREGLTNRP